MYSQMGGFFVLFSSLFFMNTSPEFSERQVGVEWKIGKGNFVYAQFQADCHRSSVKHLCHRPERN